MNAARTTILGLALAALPAVAQGSITATAPGGSTQRVSLEGCQGEFLFNGVWRLRVREAKPERNNYLVTIELRNGTSVAVNPRNTGIYGDESAFLTLSNDDSLSLGAAQAVFFDQFARKNVAPAGGGVYTFRFAAGRADAGAKPAKFLLQVDLAEYAKNRERFAGKVGYTTKNPSFRVDLTCKR